MVIQVRSASRQALEIAAAKSSNGGRIIAEHPAENLRTAVTLSSVDPMQYVNGRRISIPDHGRPPMTPPYTRLAGAELAAREQHPDAFAVRAIWTPNADTDIHVEVWTRCERTGQPRADVVRA